MHVMRSVYSLGRTRTQAAVGPAPEQSAAATSKALATYCRMGRDAPCHDGRWQNGILAQHGIEGHAFLPVVVQWVRGVGHKELTHGC